MENQAPVQTQRYVLVQGLAGCAAGITADLVVHPMDTLRAQIMMQRGGEKSLGVGNLLAKVMRDNGIRGLYRGFGAVAMLTGPAHGLYFGVYRSLKQHFADANGGESTAAAQMIAGFVAEVAGASLWVPMDVIKGRLQVQDMNPSGNVVYRGSLHTATTIVRQEGIGTLFKGFWMGVAVYGPFAGVYFATYEHAKLMLARMMDADAQNLPFWGNLGCGYAAGSLAGAATNPLDIAKTRYQVQSEHGHNFQYSSPSQALVRIAREEGLAGLMRGSLVRSMFWIAPNTAITIATFEWMARWIDGLLPE